jgi:hypothetical protein
MGVRGLARRRTRLTALAVSALIGVVAAVINSGVISLAPPKLDLNNLRIAAATGYVEVDPPASLPSLPFSRGNPPLDVQTFVKRAELLGRTMMTRPVLQNIAARCRVPSSGLSGLGRTTANVSVDFTQPDSEQRASDIAASLAPYRMEVQARPTVPIIDVYAQAPSVASATCLADAAPLALTDYLRGLAHTEKSNSQLVRLRPLGPARGGVVNGGATIMVAVLTFVTFFALALVALRTVERTRRRRSSGPADPLPAEYRPAESAGDSWPHTKRLMPWMLAFFITLVWLTPFNDISLHASLPIELRLDRLVLPIVAFVWLLSLAVGGRYAPRLRLTWVHIALGALLACAFLSVVTDAHYLNQTLELSLSLKKLPLLLAYVSLFVIAASAVRRSEVRPFMTYTLALAVIVALEMVYEYHTKQNLFWDWSQKLLPSSFTLDLSSGTSAVDYIGRRLVRGPTDVPLEAVAMLAMALPIALVRILESARTRPRILYGVITCLLFAAIFATYRKSALLAPVAVLVTLAYFRRKQLLKLAPLGLVMLAMVSAISPGALGSTLSQFTRSDAAAVPTVSDRTSDYDAIRPDVLSHLLLGRGWGSYNHQTYRILDSEVLTRTIETGVLGLIVFLAVPASVVVVSRRTIALRDPEATPIALIGACVAASFLVLAFLFDELAFPHPVYIFLYMAGLETVILQPAARRRAPPPPPGFTADAPYEPELEPVLLAEAEAPLVAGR